MGFKSHWWWDHTARDFATMDMSNVVAVLPVGAVEQHGPHLPVRVDAAINAGIMERTVAIMPDDLPVLVLPPQHVGKSVEHLRFPGTLTLSYETIAKVWYEIGESVHRAGIRKLVLANSHGGQISIMEIVARELRIKLGMFVVCLPVTAGADFSPLFAAQEMRHGIHAGEYETSALLALHPELCDMEHAPNGASVSQEIEGAGGRILPIHGRLTLGWMAQDLHPSGVAGNAAAADAERGAAALDLAAQNLLSALREVVDYPLERLRETTIYDQAE
ncbi:MULTISPECIES: creatininase family protein [unclassified Haematobacter]|uniref:creatininase family protein n=1 Tax=unclassified Haematobacter TaxID=2640585 RepID=UPI0025BCE4AD|nr:MULTISPECIES: creatininase family protein [unclassified Haematobacter]